MNTALMFASAADGWRTPPQLFALLDREFGFGIDVAADADNALCPRYYTRQRSALDPHRCWHTAAGPAWCNPPYGRGVSAWTARAVREAQQCRATVVLLVAARTDTGWWHTDVLPYADEIRLLRGRLVFGNGPTAAAAGAPFPSAIVVFRPSAGRMGTGPRIWGWDWRAQRCAPPRGRPVDWHLPGGPQGAEEEPV